MIIQKIVIFFNFPTETWQIETFSLKVRFKNNRRKRNKMQCINLHQELHFEKKTTTLVGFALSNKPLLTEEEKSLPASTDMSKSAGSQRQNSTRNYYFFY